VIVCSSPSPLIKALVVLLLAYPVVLIALRGSGRRHTFSVVVVPVVITPLLLGASGTLLMLARVMQGVTMSGGGRASRAAGVAEALLTVVFAAGVAAAASAIAIVQEVLAQRRPRPEGGSRGAHMPQIVAVCVAVAVLVWAGFLTWKAAGSPLTSKDYVVPIIGACVALCAALGSCVWLVVLRRRDVAFQSSHPIVASLVALAVCGAMGLGTWQVVQHFTAIAIAK